MTMQFVASMNIRYMNLETRPLERLQGVIHGDGRKRITCRIDDKSIGVTSRRLYLINQNPFMV